MSGQKDNVVKTGMPEKDESYGRRWQNKATFKDFESADILRNMLLKSKKIEVKVKKLASDKFVVKERKKISPQAKSKKGKKKQSR